MQIEQTGAALVVSLMLVAALGVLAITGIGDVTTELAMTRNLALTRGVGAAAASGIELALASGPLDIERNTEVTLTLGASNEYVVTATTRFLGTSAVPGGGFSMGASAGSIAAHHFEIAARAHGPRGSRALQRQGVYVLGPPVHQR